MTGSMIPRMASRSRCSAGGMTIAGSVTGPSIAPAGSCVHLSSEGGYTGPRTVLFMEFSRDTRPKWFYRVLLLAILAANAAALWPDLAASRVDLNDNVSHFAMVRRITQAVE